MEQQIVESSTIKPSPRRSRLLLLLFSCLALLLRFIIAPSPQLEFRPDTLLFEAWGEAAYTHGLTNIYHTPITYPSSAQPEVNTLNLQKDVNYFPPQLILGEATTALRWFIAPLSNVGSSVASVFQKIPAILADIATALLLWHIVRRRASEQWALAAAAIYLFHPAVFYLSSGWGQVDSLFTFFLVLSVWLIETKRLLSASATLTVAFFFKIQTLALVPLLFFELIQTRSEKTILKSASVALITAAIINLPFILTGHSLEVVSVIFGLAGRNALVSIYAFNFWWFITGGHGNAISDQLVAGGSAPIFVAFVLYACALVLILEQYWKNRSGIALWYAASLLAFAFFLFPTEIHERYLFPFLALALPVLPFLASMRFVYALMSVVYGLNIAYVFFRFMKQTIILSPQQTVALAGLNLAIFLFLVTRNLVDKRTLKNVTTDATNG